MGLSNQPLFVKPDQAFAVSAPEIQFHVLLCHSGRAFSLAVVNRVACAAPVGAKQVIHFERKALAKPNPVRVAPDCRFLIAVADANNADRAALASRGFAYLAHRSTVRHISQTSCAGHDSAATEQMIVATMSAGSPPLLANSPIAKPVTKTIIDVQRIAR